MNSLILTACLNIIAASDYGIVEIEETWDGRRVLKRRVRQADDDELGSGESVEPLPSVSRVDVLIRVEMNTKIPFSQNLRNKESDEYQAKKEELLEELRTKLEIVASIEDAELQFQEIEIEFEETSGELRQSTGQNVKAVISIPYRTESSDFLNEEQEQRVEDELRETTIITLSSMLEDGLAEDSLLDSDPDFRFSSTRQSFDLTRWNHARLNFNFYNATLLLFISLKLLL